MTRYKPGFYPATDEGSCSKIGKGAGLGYNINVPFDQGGAENAERGCTGPSTYPSCKDI